MTMKYVLGTQFSVFPTDFSRFLHVEMDKEDNLGGQYLLRRPIMQRRVRQERVCNAEAGEYRDVMQDIVWLCGVADGIVPRFEMMSGSAANDTK